MSDSSIALLTDDGLILSVTIDDKKLEVDKKNAGYNFTPQLKKCLVCHHFEQSTPSSIAPTLANIFNRKAGSDSFERYSTAMKTSEIKWTENKLRDFLSNPNKIIEGTSMPNLGLSDYEINSIIKALK